MAASNTLLTDSIITNEALAVLVNNFVLGSRALRPVDSLFGKVGYKAGNTIRVRVPVRYTSALGSAINLQNSVESQVNLTLNQRNIGMDFSSQDRTLSIDMFSSRFIKPAMAQLASDIDADGFALYYLAQNLSTPGALTAGVPAAWTGAAVSDLLTYLNAGAVLDIQAAPRDGDRFIACSPYASAGIVNGLKGLFQDSYEIAEQYKTGLMGIAAGFQWVMSQNVPTFTAGSRSATGSAVNGSGSSVTGSTLVLKTAGTGTTYVQGDQFTIAGVYAINPLNRIATSALQVFTVLGATQTSAAGAVTLTIAPAISVTAPNQTVSAAAADSAVVTFIGAASAGPTDVNFAWHKNAIMIAFCDLTDDLPGAEATVVRDTEGGSDIALRFVRQYQASDDNTYYRLDVLYGWQVVRPSLAVRIQG